MQVADMLHPVIIDQQSVTNALDHTKMAKLLPRLQDTMIKAFFFETGESAPNCVSSFSILNHQC
jgi:hypothetical protein